VVFTGNVAGTFLGSNELSQNTIGGALSCFGNSPPPDNSQGTNTVRGARSGQCAAPFI
jgi:hypothetical protein